jgi:hypothetical protein
VLAGPLRPHYLARVSERARPSAVHGAGIVGAGRSRNGLGPFFATWLEAAGLRIAGVAGRDRAGAERAAAALAGRLGHEVAAFATAGELARHVAALVVASPPAAHLDGLAAALAAGIPCLCEKPLVPAVDTARGLELVAVFGARGIPLVENCQWPFALAALRALHPDLPPAPQRVAMGLSPTGRGRAMVEDSLSHVLSVVQALVRVDAARGVAAVRQADGAPDAERNVVTFDLAAATGPVAVELHLQHVAEQPRPAWLSVDGRRMDRRIGEGYSTSFVRPDGRAVPVPDLLQQLVQDFVGLVQNPRRERTAAHADAIVTRLRCYQGVLAGLG